MDSWPSRTTPRFMAVLLKVKVKVWTLAIAPLTWVRLVTNSALQSRKWQLIGMSQWCRNALCGHPLPALTDNWTHDAASRHTIAPISHTSLYPVAGATTHFPSRWGQEAELAWAHSRLATCSSCLQWTGCESNPQPLDYESDTLWLYRPLQCTHQSHASQSKRKHSEYAAQTFCAKLKL